MPHLVELTNYYPEFSVNCSILYEWLRNPQQFEALALVSENDANVTSQFLHLSSLIVVRTPNRWRLCQGCGKRPFRFRCWGRAAKIRDVALSVQSALNAGCISRKFHAFGWTVWPYWPAAILLHAVITGPNCATYGCARYHTSA